MRKNPRHERRKCWILLGKMQRLPSHFFWFLVGIGVCLFFPFGFFGRIGSSNFAIYMLQSFFSFSVCWPREKVFLFFLCVLSLPFFLFGILCVRVFCSFCGLVSLFVCTVQTQFVTL